MKIRVRRGARYGLKPWQVRLMVLQETWRIDWRTPHWLPLIVVVTLRRWIE